MSPKKLQDDWVALQDRLPPYVTYKMHRPLQSKLKPNGIIPVITIVTNIGRAELRTNDLPIKLPKFQGYRRIEEVVAETTGQHYRTNKDWLKGAPINDPRRIVAIILGTAQVRQNPYNDELYPFPVNMATFQEGMITEALPPVTLVPIFLKEK